jgi:uncharacterized protein YjdB
MQVLFRHPFIKSEQTGYTNLYSYFIGVMLLLVMNLFVSPTSAQDLDPTLPPSGNFDLSYWKLTRPNNTERDEDALINGYQKEGEFYTDSITGAMVFWCPNNGRTTTNTSFPRTELREMIRRGDTRISTQGINKNNWVFSSSTLVNQEAAGGVDGVMTATLKVDHVSETSDEFRKVGRTIVGQIHASDDEPCRLYYRKLPDNERGSIYFAHEPTTGPEQWYDMIGSRSDNQPDPEDGIALGEIFSYEIKVIGNLLTVTIMREGKPDVVEEVDMTDSGFANDWMYYRAGNYNQNNAGDEGEFAQVSFFALDVIHFEPTPPEEFLAPSDIPRFQPFLSGCKLQAPTSSTLASIDRLNSSYTHPEYFYVVDGDKILFNQSGDSRRTELRHETNWNLNDQNRSLHGRIDIVEQTCDQVTVMQIHDDANAGPGPNKPLLRIYKHNAKEPANNLWAAIKTDDGGVNTTHVALGEDPGGYFNCDIRLVDGNMIIDFEGEEKVNMDVSFWTFPSYWKAGVYLQDDGEATAYFDDLFEEDGSPQNFFPSVVISSPTSGTNFLPGSDVTITAEADDSDGSITRVEFFEGGSNKLGEVTSPPYAITWPNVDAGNYTISARAYDNEGGARTSLSTNISVQVQVGVTGVDLADISGAIAVGASTELEAIVSPTDATNLNMSFESDDPTIATVDENGVLTAISEGVVTITVTTEDGSYVDSELIHVLTPSTDFNWALNQPVVGSAAPDGPNDEDNLVDDSTGTRWSVQEFPQSAVVDLEGNITITRTEVTCYEDRAYQFIIEGALDVDGPYTMIVDRTRNRLEGALATPIINTIDSIEARYVRITVMSADVYTGQWVSLTELRVFGEGERTFSTSTNELEENTITLTPNPASTIINIQGGEAYNRVTIFDQSGKRVFQSDISRSGTFDVSELQSGIYLVTLESNDKRHVVKMVKQ